MLQQLLLAALLAVLSAEDGSGEDPAFNGDAGTWVRGRTSWYGEPDWVEPFAATRGGGRSAFGVLEWGACGYTNGDGEIMTAKEESAAYSDDNPDYPGSCGRCYEVKCVDGPVVGPRDVPIPLEELYYFPKFADVPDELGRPFPGNPTEAENYYTATCYNNDSIFVKVIDLCPCYYCPANQECRYQESCCYKSIDHPKAGQPALDVSFWAFQQMAHPSYGVLTVDYRPVDCGTHEPIRFIPGSISRKLYGDMAGVGWAWFASNDPATSDNQNFYVRADGEGLGGSAAACAEIEEGKGMTWWSRGAGVPGFTPFNGDGVETISFWIKNKGSPGSPVPVRVLVSGDRSKPSNSPEPLPSDPPRVFCDAEVFLTERAPEETQGDFKKYSIPIEDFGCTPDKLPKLNKLDFLALEPTEFCVDELELL